MRLILSEGLFQLLSKRLSTFLDLCQDGTEAQDRQAHEDERTPCWRKTLNLDSVIACE